jgi:hypothetical protein
MPGKKWTGKQEGIVFSFYPLAVVKIDFLPVIYSLIVNEKPPLLFVRISAG